MSEQDQYRKIAKNTAVLGGSQLVQMLVSLIRTKVIAVLLGPAGMGFNALILSAVSTIQQFSSLGIFQSGVRDLAHVYNNENAGDFARLRKVFDRLTLYSGVLGFVVCLVLSRPLSEFSFGNSDYTWSFAAASITLLFMSLQSGKTTILQATQNLRLIAKATITGAILNLVVTVPLFYLWGMDGIVPAIISSYIIFYIVNKYFESKVFFTSVAAPTKAQFADLSKPILKLGLVLMVSSLMMVTFTFLLNGFISHFGSVSDVGLFQAAVSICMQSMVIINTTLASDYFPRLSAVHTDQKLLNETVSRQAEMTLMMIVPISALLFLFAPNVVYILFSQEYAVIVPMLQIMLLSLMFRALWMVMGFVALAKGDKITFLIFDSIIGHGLSFVLNIVAFSLFQIYGLGVSYLVGSIVMVLTLGAVLKIKYNFIFQMGHILKTIILIVALGILYLCEIMLTGIPRIITTYSIVILMVCFCLFRLNKMLNLAALLNRKLK